MNAETLGEESDVAFTSDGKKCIQLEIWRKVIGVDGKPTGMIRRDKGRPVIEIYRELRAALETEGLIDESFTLISDWHQARAPQIEKPYERGSKWRFRWDAPGMSYMSPPHVWEHETEERAREQRDLLTKLYTQVPSPLAVDDLNVQLWPEGYRWISCYAVTGGSEGHYVHIDLIFNIEHTAIGPIRTPLGMFLAKTFQGMEHAQKIATRCATLLGA